MPPHLCASLPPHRCGVVAAIVFAPCWSVVIEVVVLVSMPNVASGHTLLPIDNVANLAMAMPLSPLN